MREAPFQEQQQQQQQQQQQKVLKQCEKHLFSNNNVLKTRKNVGKEPFQQKQMFLKNVREAPFQQKKMY